MVKFIDKLGEGDLRKTLSNLSFQDFHPYGDELSQLWDLYWERSKSEGKSYEMFQNTCNLYGRVNLSNSI